MSRPRRPYLKPSRLADLFALIQVLALDEHSHRSENGLRTALQGEPASGSAWTSVASDHPEFFRVRPSGEHTVSLLSRHVLRPGEHGRSPLPADYVHELLRAAMDMHDRELATARRWHDWMPVIGTVVGGVMSLLGTMLTLWLTGHH